MFNVELYRENSSFQKIIAEKMLNLYGHLLNWKINGEVPILDAGCGEGSTTIEVLYPFIKANAEKITMVGVDISKDMIGLAATKYQLEDLTFDVMNIGNDDLDEVYLNKFQHIFSIYAVHFVRNPKKWIENFNKMLKPGGQMFVIISINSVLHKTVFELCCEDTFKPHFRDIANILPKEYSEAKECDAWIQKLLEEEGFKVDVCEIYYDCHTFSSYKNLEDFVAMCHGWMKNVPDHVYRDYIHKCTQKIYSKSCANYGEGSYKWDHTLLTIVATKA